MTKPGMAAQSVSWSGEGPLTFEDVSKLFSLPIAEAAQQLRDISASESSFARGPTIIKKPPHIGILYPIWESSLSVASPETRTCCKAAELKDKFGLGLGVSGSVLQHICKENGIPRWPYRKFIAGKSVEEIREEGLKEMAANSSAQKKGQKQQTTQSPTKPPPATLKSIPSSAPSMLKGSKSVTGAGEPSTVSPQPPQHLYRTMPAQGKTPVNGKTPAHKPGQQSPHLQMNSTSGSHVRPMGLPGQTLQKQKVGVAAPPADDFKIGFPSTGLSTNSIRWWGPGEKDSIRMESVVGGKEEGSLLRGIETVSSEAINSMTASSLLVRTRKKAALRGQNLLPHAITRGYGIHRLGEKDAATLRFVFGDHLPKHWVASLPPVL